MHEYESEIHKLLRIGDTADDHTDHDVPHGLPVLALEPSMAGIDSAVVDKKGLMSLLIYPLIFLLAFGFFYIVLNFSALSAQFSGWFAKPQAEEILGTESAEYFAWIGNYFYAVGDRSLLEPTNDIDKDGLSNLDEFIIRTNPIVADSEGDSFSDGIEIINNQNPWGSGGFTSEQRKLAENLNMIMINNRVSFNASVGHEGLVSGANTQKFDLERPGRLSIPKLNLQVDLIWSKDASNFDADLTKGVIHYPGTAMPGENGIIYVSGHSSDYIWKRNPMHSVFARINQLSAGDDIFIDVYGTDGKVYNFRYQVSHSRTYKADDQTQFIDTAGSKLNLSTCWPIGTQKDRLVVTAVPVSL